VTKYGQQAALLCVRFNCIVHSTVTRCVVSAYERRSLVGQSTLLVPNAAPRRSPTFISKCFGDAEYTHYVDYKPYCSTIISHSTIGRWKQVHLSDPSKYVNPVMVNLLFSASQKRKTVLIWLKQWLILLRFLSPAHKRMCCMISVPCFALSS
jgi:hypothetical protein